MDLFRAATANQLNPIIKRVDNLFYHLLLLNTTGVGRSPFVVHKAADHNAVSFKPPQSLFCAHYFIIEIIANQLLKQFLVAAEDLFHTFGH